MAIASMGKKPKTRVGKWWNQLFGRIFCKRSIIIISEHKTQHVPFAIGMQFSAMLAVMAVVGWASYSSGSYMAAQTVLEKKDEKIAATTQENARVAAEFSLLKRDLMKLVDEEASGRTGKLGDFAKMVSEQYKDNDGNIVGQEFAQGMASGDAKEKYDAVFSRIDYLENKVKELQSTHEELVADIRNTTGGKIAELERVIAMTGVDRQPLVKKVEAKTRAEDARREKYGRIEAGQGGPFIPVKTSVLKEKEADLYFDLKRMMVLNEIVATMPLSNPMAISNYRRSSGYGTRIDPFRGRLAFHSGVDLAGPPGTKIKAASDGRVTFTGWKGAYGKAVDVNHGLGFVSRYGHLSNILVKEGQFVKKGDIIAVQGSTGRSTGNHLHYEVRYNNEPLNPNPFLKAGNYVR